MSGVGGISAYQQTSQLWKQNAKASEVDTKSGAAQVSEDTKTKSGNSVKTNAWKPINTAGSLVPTKQEGIGMAIGEVQLSDKAKDYYNQLKSKFGNMQFIAVSGDMKEKVKANAAAYGNSSKTVVLIDEAKLEQMADDESFRKKYEGIISMSRSQMESAKNSLASSGASIKNFGMSVNSDGTTSFFATLEKSSSDQAKRIEKKQAEKKAAKAKEKKIAEKKAQEKRLEKAKEEKKTENSESKEEATWDDKEYVKIEANSLNELVNKVSKYAYDNSEKSVVTDAEKVLGQNFDFKG